MEWFISDSNKSQSFIGDENQFRVAEFLSQPFTPEMLEYFEGWEMEDEITNKRYYFEIIGLYYYERNSEWRVYDREDNSYCFKSLNDLITLCNLAGVELTWKGEK
jgi:hypothetical protein